MKLQTTPLVLLALLTTWLAPTAAAQRTAPRPSPTRSLVRELPSANGRKPAPVTAQEPTQDGLDADAAAVFRPREDIDPADVVLSNGEVRLERSELFLLGRAGLNFELVRRYRSQLDYSGPLGYGWDFNYNERLYDAPGGDKLRLNGAGHVDTWTRNGDGSFNAPAGFFGTLVENSDGSFTLREPGGMKHHYRPKGRLSALEDRHGNRIRFNHVEGQLVSATDVFGRVIRFFYAASPDGRERLARVRDFTGREIVYTYDTNGDLVAARSPIIVGTSTGNDFPGGTTERYAYHDDHNLEAVTFPNEVAVGGPPAMQYAYDDQDRVTSWMLGGTNASGVPAGGTVAFAYQMLNAGTPLGDPSVARLRTTVVERNGNSYDVDVNELQHRLQSRRFTRGLRPGEPPFYLTRWDHDADGQLTRLIRPRGNGELFTYDNAGSRAAQRDLVEWRRVADAVTFGGPEEDLVWTYAYDPVYHQRVSTTDPRENSPSFVPPIGSNAPGRYTTRRFVDYQEGSDPIPDAVPFGISLGSFPRGLGDLNADGRTDQTAGNVVRREGAAVTLEAGSPLALELGSTTQEIVTETWWNDFGQRVGEIDPEGNMTTWSYHPEADPAGLAAGPQPPSLTDGGYRFSSVVDATDTYRRRSVTDVLALMAHVELNERGDTTARFNPRGIRTGYEVNERGTPIVTTRGDDVSQAPADQLPTGESALRYEEEQQIDANGNVICRLLENDPASDVSPGIGAELEIGMSYDILNHVLEARVELDATRTAVTAYTYDPSGNRSGVVYPVGNQDAITWDERHSIFDVTSGQGTPEAGTHQYTYEPNGYLDSSVDPCGAQTDFVYDGFDRRTEQREPLGYSLQLSFDPTSNITARLTYGHPAGDPTGTPELQAEVHYDFDEQSRNYRLDEHVFVPASTPPTRPFDVGDGVQTTRSQFDANDDLRYQIDDLDRVSSRTLDGARRLIGTMDSVGNEVHYGLDANSNVVERIEIDVQPEGMLANQMFVFSFVYDQLNRRVRATEPGGFTRRFGFDSLNNLAWETDARGAVIPDPLGLVSGTINSHGNRIDYAYEGRGLRLEATYAQRELGEATNPLDTSNFFNPDGLSSVRWERDLNGRETAMIDDVGNRTEWTWSARDWIDSQTLPQGGAFNWTYDANGNWLTRAQPNGFSVARTYDKRNRTLTETRTAAPASQVGGVTFKSWSWIGLDLVHETQSLSASFAPPPPSTSVDTRSIFDSRGMMIEESVCGLVTSYTRNGTGAIAAFTYADDRTVTYGLDSLDRPTSVSDSVNGALITGAYRFGENRLIQLLYGNGTVDMHTYDARRLPSFTGVYASLGGTLLMDDAWDYTRAGQLRGETSTIVGSGNYDWAADISSTGQLLESRDPSAIVRYRRNGAGILETLVETLPGPTIVNTPFTVDANGAHAFVDIYSQFVDANGNQGEFYPYQFQYNHDDQVAYIVPVAFGSPKEYIYDASGRLAMTVELLNGQPYFRVYTYADGELCQEWQVTDGTKTLLASYVNFDGKQVLNDNGTPIGTFFEHHGARGILAKTYLDPTATFGQLVNVLVNYTEYGNWSPVGGTYGVVLGSYFLDDWRLEPFNLYMNKFGDVWEFQTGRFMAREEHLPGDLTTIGNFYQGGQVPAPAVPDAMAEDAAPFVLCEDKRRLFSKREFRLDRLEAIEGVRPSATCMHTVRNDLRREPDDADFLALLARDFTRADAPRVGDVLILDPDSGLSHTAFITRVTDGRIGTLGKGSSGAPVEHYDARDFGDEHAPVTANTLAFYRRNGKELSAPARAAIVELDRLTETLPDSAAKPFADHLLYLLQRHNGR